MTLLETPTLKKITVAVLALALASWLGVGVYHFKTNWGIKQAQEKESLPLAPSLTTPLLKKSSYTEYTDEINRFFIKFPKVWELDPEVGSEDQAFVLFPVDEGRDIYPEVFLSIKENAEKLPVLEWIKVNHPDVEEGLLQPMTDFQLESFKLDKVSKSTVYVNDKDSGKVYIFSAYPVLEEITKLTDEGREKFVEVVSTFELRR